MLRPCKDTEKQRWCLLFLFWHILQRRFCFSFWVQDFRLCNIQVWLHKQLWFFRIHQTSLSQYQNHNQGIGLLLWLQNQFHEIDLRRELWGKPHNWRFIWDLHKTRARWQQSGVDQCKESLLCIHSRAVPEPSENCALWDDIRLFQWTNQYRLINATYLVIYHFNDDGGQVNTPDAFFVIGLKYLAMLHFVQFWGFFVDYDGHNEGNKGYNGGRE